MPGTPEGGRGLDEAGADPVAGAGAAGPQLGGEAVLLGLRRLVGVLGGAAEALPGGRQELVVAGRARGVGRKVLAAGLALDDRVRDRPRPARGPRRRRRPGPARVRVSPARARRRGCPRGSGSTRPRARRARRSGCRGGGAGRRECRSARRGGAPGCRRSPPAARTARSGERARRARRCAPRARSARSFSSERWTRLRKSTVSIRSVKPSALRITVTRSGASET